MHLRLERCRIKFCGGFLAQVRRAAAGDSIRLALRFWPPSLIDSPNSRKLIVQGLEQGLQDKVRIRSMDGRVHTFNSVSDKGPSHRERDKNAHKAPTAPASLFTICYLFVPLVISKANETRVACRAAYVEALEVCPEVAHAIFDRLSKFERSKLLKYARYHPYPLMRDM